MTTKAERSLDRKVQAQQVRIAALEDLVRILATHTVLDPAHHMNADQTALFTEVVRA